jgi:hypothetical protein
VEEGSGELQAGLSLSPLFSWVSAESTLTCCHRLLQLLGLLVRIPSHPHPSTTEPRFVFGLGERQGRRAYSAGVMGKGVILAAADTLGLLCHPARHSLV